MHTHIIYITYTCKYTLTGTWYDFCPIENDNDCSLALIHRSINYLFYSIDTWGLDCWQRVKAVNQNNCDVPQYVVAQQNAVSDLLLDFFSPYTLYILYVLSHIQWDYFKAPYTNVKLIYFAKFIFNKYAYELRGREF